MEEVTSADPPAEQDILIIKDLIANDKYSHTAYVYNNSAWEAMDGNYNAKNVYFKNDFIFTEPVGTVSIPESGNQIVSAAGKNVEEFLAEVFAKEKSPAVTQPIIDIYSTAVSTSYEVGSTFTPGYTTRLDPGNYEFGPSTGVTIIKYDISDTLKNTSDKDSDTFNSVIVEDNFSYTVSGKITYSDGVIPNTNLGNPYTEGQIKSKTLEPSSTTVVSHRNTFYGTLEVKNDFASIDSTVIRNLKSSKKGYKNGSTFDITIPVGAMRVIIAYPSDLRDLTSVLDVNALRAEIVSSFQQIENGVAVKGYNNYEAKNYKVYILDYAFPTSTQNIYKVTI